MSTIDNNNRVKFDLHTHHKRCGHADGVIEDYIQSAIAQGFQAIGISDHTPYFAHNDDHPFPGIAMARSEFSNYIAEVQSLKQKYDGKIDVLLGIESDFFPQHVSLYETALNEVPFDYVIGSVHQVSGVSIFNKNRWKGLTDQEKIETKELYYDLIAQSARSGLFQILGHIDAMKGYYPPFSDIPTSSKIDETLKIIADCNVAIEINTSGSTKEVGGWYPSDDILARAYHYGVKVTFGSDAHTPKRIGDDFNEVANRLKEIGYTSWVYYKNRQAIEVSL